MPPVPQRTPPSPQRAPPPPPPPQPSPADRAAQEALDLERAIQLSLKAEQQAERQRRLEEEAALEAARKLEEEERKAAEMAALRERSAVNERARASKAKEAAAAAAKAPAADRAYDSDGSVHSTSTFGSVETGGPAGAADAAPLAPWASVDALSEALGGVSVGGVSVGGGRREAAVRTGMGVGEWANCELLMPLLTAVLPSEEVLEALGIVLLDIPTAQLLKLADADQQCEAIIDGPQCAGMRKRMASAKLVLALINDNEDAEVMDGGRHWSVVAQRREAWRHGTCVFEHYDPSGERELNCDAAQQYASSLAERLSEVRAVDADRIEVWRMGAPTQHDPNVCGLTALAYLRALIDSFVEASSPGAAASLCKAGEAPRTPAAVGRVTWREVEALRQAACRAWSPPLLEPAEAYASELAAKGRPSKLAAAERHVVFDLHEDEADDENFDELEMDAGSAFLEGSAMQLHAEGGGAPVDASLYDFLQAVGLGATAGVIGRTGLTLAACAEAALDDRTVFLAQLRDLGVTRLADRQGFANALGKARREGWLAPPYKGPFTNAGRQLRSAREAAPNAPAPQAHHTKPLPAGQYDWLRKQSW